MQPASGLIGFQGLYAQHRQSFAPFEQEYDPDASTSETAENDRSPPMSFYSKDDEPATGRTAFNMSASYVDTELYFRRLCTPMLNVVFSEITDVWFKQRWLTFDDDRKETFLTLNPNTTGSLTVQTAIDQRSFLSSRRRLVVQPECLLIRTEPQNKSLLLPNDTIAFDPLLERNLRPSRAQLVAIFCRSKEADGRLMFYKHLQRNIWYVYFNDSDSAESHSNMLSEDEQNLLESAEDRHRQTSPLAYPLSALAEHPLTFVYVTRNTS